MAIIPVSHATEQPGAIQFPWVIRCQKCGCEVARLDQAELTAMVMSEEVSTVICFDCELIASAREVSPVTELEQNKRSPYPCISVPKRFLGFI